MSIFLVLSKRTMHTRYINL